MMSSTTTTTRRNQEQTLFTDHSAFPSSSSSPAVVSTSNSPSTSTSGFHHHSQRRHTSHSYPNNVSGSRRGSTSASIPITHNGNSLRRTASETQLHEDEIEADYKDYMFYSRVVNGIMSKQHSFYKDDTLKHETQQCLNNIVRARHDDALNHQHSSGPYFQDHRDESLVSPMMKQPGGQHYYYYATTANNDGYKHQQHRTQRLLRFTTEALSYTDPQDEDTTEEGIFDLEL